MYMCVSVRERVSIQLPHCLCYLCANACVYVFPSVMYSAVHTCNITMQGPRSKEALVALAERMAGEQPTTKTDILHTLLHTLEDSSRSTDQPTN